MFYCKYTFLQQWQLLCSVWFSSAKYSRRCRVLLSSRICSPSSQNNAFACNAYCSAALRTLRSSPPWKVGLVDISSKLSKLNYWPPTSIIFRITQFSFPHHFTYSHHYTQRRHFRLAGYVGEELDEKKRRIENIICLHAAVIAVMTHLPPNSTTNCIKGKQRVKLLDFNDINHLNFCCICMINSDL